MDVELKQLLSYKDIVLKSSISLFLSSLPVFRIFSPHQAVVARVTRESSLYFLSRADDISWKLIEHERININGNTAASREVKERL